MAGANLPWVEDHWDRRVVIEQVRKFQPEILYLQNLYFFDSALRKELREVCAKKVFMVGWRFAPTTDYTDFGDLDLVLTGSAGYVDAFRSAGVNSELLRLAFEPRADNEYVGEPQRDLPFTFAGSVGGPDGFWVARYRLIEQLLESSPLEVWGVPAPDTPRMGLREAVRAARQWIRGKTPPRPPKLFGGRFIARCHPPLYGPDYVRLLQRSCMTLNVHADCADAYAGNIRLFEATGFGACLLTDAKKDICDMFEPGAELVTYNSPEDCVEKARYLLDHDDRRLQIGRAGYRRAIRNHTWDVRSGELLDILKRRV
jgi:glycosyltransferase involved in cell wall biosynthesis